MFPSRDARPWAEPQPSASHVIPRQVCSSQVALFDSSAPWPKNIPSRVSGASGEATVKYVAPSVVILVCNQFQFWRRGTWADCAGALKEPGRTGQRDQSERGAGRMPTFTAVVAAPLGRFLKFLFTQSGDGRDLPCDEVEVATHQVQMKRITLAQVQDSTPWGTSAQNVFPFNCRRLLLVLCWASRYHPGLVQDQSRNKVSGGNLSEKNGSD